MAYNPPASTALDFDLTPSGYTAPAGTALAFNLSGTLDGITTELPLFEAAITGPETVDVSLPLFYAEIHGPAVIEASLPLMSSNGMEDGLIACDVSLECFTTHVTMADPQRIVVSLPLLSTEILGNAVAEVSIPLFTTEILGNAVAEVSLPLFACGTGDEKCVLLHERECWTEPTMPLFETLASTFSSCFINPYKIIIDHTKFTEPIGNFPVRLKLGAVSGLGAFNASGLFAALKTSTNRYKIAVTLENQRTQCYVEIEPGYDFTAEVLNLWVKVPFISATEDTILYLFFDISMANNTDYVGDTGSAAAKQVWDSSYVAVYHLAQYSYLAGGIKDSTSNANHAQAYNMSAASLVDGPVGKALDFDNLTGGEDSTRVVCPDTDALNITGNLTVEAMAAPDMSESFARVVCKSGPAVSDYQHNLRVQVTGGVPFYETVVATDIMDSGLASEQATSGLVAGVMNENTYLASTINASTQTLGITVNGTKASAVYTGTRYASVNPFTIGYRPETPTFPNFTGPIDEVRISNVVRSDNWLNATRYSLFDQLITWACLDDPVLGDEAIQWVFHSSHIYNNTLPLFRASGLTNALLSNVVLPRFRSFIGFAAEIGAELPGFRAQGMADTDYLDSIAVSLPKFRGSLAAAVGQYCNIECDLPKFRTLMVGVSNRPGTIAVQMAKFVAGVTGGHDVSAEASALMPFMHAAVQAKSDKEFFKLMYRHRPWD